MASPTWSSILGRLDAGQGLDADSARWAVEQIMSGQADPEDVKAFLLGVQAKGATAEEVAGAADAMRAAALPVEVPGILLDVVGTGGDSSGSVNFSTMAAIVAAACGATIVKHGNRAASSRSALRRASCIARSAGWIKARCSSTLTQGPCTAVSSPCSRSSLLNRGRNHAERVFIANTSALRSI